MTNYCKLNAMALCDCEKKTWSEQKDCDFATGKSSGGDWCMHYNPEIGSCDNINARRKAEKEKK